MSGVSPLSASSIEWIDEAMRHNAVGDGEHWFRMRMRDAVGTDEVSAWHFGTVDWLGNIVRRPADAGAA